MKTDNTSFRAFEWKYKEDQSELAKEIADLKDSGKKVVFTNGCFDILHIGHVRYLQDSRALGDALVVGVNADETVRLLKGPQRPIVSENERVEILAALECVDYVVIFSERLPTDLILKLKPSIHVKGGDYTEDQMPEAAPFRAIGGEVVIIPFTSTDTQGLSTTNTIGRIKDN